MENQAMRRYGYGVTPEVLRNIVREVLRSRAPDKLGIVPRLPLSRDSSDITEQIRETLGDELVDTGLGPDGEPTERGRLIEAAIDWLGHG